MIVYHTYEYYLVVLPFSGSFNDQNISWTSALPSFSHIFFLVMLVGVSECHSDGNIKCKMQFDSPYSAENILNLK